MIKLTLPNGDPVWFISGFIIEPSFPRQLDTETHTRIELNGSVRFVKEKPEDIVAKLRQPL